MAELLIDDYLEGTPADTADVVSGVAAGLVEEGRGTEAIALVDRARAVLPGDSLLLARGFPAGTARPGAGGCRRHAQGGASDARTIPTALNALGYTLVDRTRSVEEGTQLIARAIVEKPDSYAIQDSMGWALVQSGRLEEGKSWLDKAWTGSEDPEVAAHLGETLWRMGRTAEAKTLWNEALAGNPDSRPLQRAIERHAQ